MFAYAALRLFCYPHHFSSAPVTVHNTTSLLRTPFAPVTVHIRHPFYAHPSLQPPWPAVHQEPRGLHIVAPSLLPTSFGHPLNLPAVHQEPRGLGEHGPPVHQEQALGRGRWAKRMVINNMGDGLVWRAWPTCASRTNAWTWQVERLVTKECDREVGRTLPTCASRTSAWMWQVGMCGDKKCISVVWRTWPTCVSKNKRLDVAGGQSAW
jgi:hypothetical protein